MFFKAPGQAGYEPHQDQAWWTAFGQSCVTCLVAIDAADKMNGGLSFLLNAHHTLLTEVDKPRFLDGKDLQAFQNHSWYLPELKAGDMVFL